MKTMARIAALAAFSVASVGFGFADTLTLASYGSTNSAPAGVSNTATVYSGGPSYNVPTGGMWSNPVGNSSWVSNSPNDYPGGGAYSPNGTYTFTSTFTDLTPGSSGGSITVMADDSTSVFLNGVLIAAAAAPNPAPHCTVNTPNCTTPATYSLTGFIAGTNVLRFDVTQDFDNALGIDFAATVNTATPEPGSLMLLGTGLLGLGSKLYRRRSA